MSKFKKGDITALEEVKKTQILIEEWFIEETEKINTQEGIEDFTKSETVQIYQQELTKNDQKITYT